MSRENTRNTVGRLPSGLPPLPLEEWDSTKQTLHLWAQIVGKIRMASTAPRNHWWHVPLYVDVRGLTTRRMHSAEGVSFQVDFDFIDHTLAVKTSRGETRSFALVDGLSVADFDARLHAMLGELGVDVTIAENPFGLPVITPFPEDLEHRPTTRTQFSASGGSSTGRTLCSRSSPAGSVARPARCTSSGTRSTSL